MVCLHGMWGFALIYQFWFALGEMLGIKMFSIELPGHSKDLNYSGLAKQTIDSYVQIVDDVIRSQIGDCILMGWSMGARISREVAQQNSCVKKVVLITSPPPPGVFFHPKVLLKMIRYGLSLTFGTPFRLTKSDAVKLAFNHGFTLDEQDTFIAQLGPESGHAARDVTLEQLFFWKTKRKSFRCPMLVVAGEFDALTPVALQRKMAERYIGAEYREIPGACHSIMLQPVVREIAFRDITGWVYDMPKAA